MRYLFYCSLLAIFVSGVAACQETTFERGPQYLITSGSPLFARSISTPTMALEGPPSEIGASDATETLTAGSQEQTPAWPQSAPQPAFDLFPIYYGDRPVPAIETREINPVDRTSSENPEGSAINLGVGGMITAWGKNETSKNSHASTPVAANHVYTNEDIARLKQRQE